MKQYKTILSGENCQKGFSILEVIVSIAILSIGILATARMQTVAVRGTSLAGRLTTDTVAAQDLIERVVSANYSDPSLVDTNDNGESGLDNVGNGSADLFVDNPSGHYTVSMNVADNVPINNTKSIRVIVETQAPGGTKKTIYDFIKAQLTRP